MLKLLATRRFNYIDVIAIAMAVHYIVTGAYISAAILFVSGSLLSVYTEHINAKTS